MKVFSAVSFHVTTRYLVSNLTSSDATAEEEVSSRTGTDCLLGAPLEVHPQVHLGALEDGVGYVYVEIQSALVTL